VHTRADLMKVYRVAESAVPFLGANGNQEINKKLILLYHQAFNITPAYNHLEVIVPLYLKEKRMGSDTLNQEGVS